jgi:thiamine pyrophosphate-dependent acetolactate synthase large subunit-like protein
VRRELGFNFIQEVDFQDVYRGCSVFCEMILTPDQALRKTVMACQAAISKRGVAVLIVPVDIADSDATGEPPFRVHVNRPVIRPSDEDLDQIADMLAEGTNITIYAGSGCVGAHDEVVQLAERLKAPVAYTSRGKDEIEYDNPNNVGMTGVIGTESGYHAILNCDTTVQENLPIKIAVYDNGKLGFVELEQKGEGMLPVYTNLTNPDFGKVAEAMGLWGKTVSKAEDLEGAVAEWLGQPGAALLNVKVEPMELVMPPFTAPEAVYGMAMYSIKAVMHGKAGDVFEMIGENT